MINLLVPAIILFFLASFLKISFIYNVAYLLFAVFVLSSLWTRRSLEDIRFVRTIPERALLGDVIDIVLEAENLGWLPAPWVLVYDRLPIALAVPPFFRALVPFNPRERRRFTYQLTCRTRGWYEVGPLTISLGDVFGITSRQRAYAAPAHLTVYPRILSLDELGFPSKSPFGVLRARQPLYEDPARVVGIRDYQIGDSMRRINWKATASAGALQVRRLEPAMTLQTVIFLNVFLRDYERRAAYGAAEVGVVVAASVANHLVSLRQEVGLLTNGSDPATADPSEGSAGLIGYLPGKGRGHLNSILELLGRLELAHERAFWPLVRTDVKRLPWGATLVFVVPTESDTLLETVVILRRSGFNVVLVYVDYPVGEQFEMAERRARGLGMTAVRIWREDDLDRWRRQGGRLEANLARG